MYGMLNLPDNQSNNLMTVLIRLFHLYLTIGRGNDEKSVFHQRERFVKQTNTIQVTHKKKSKSLRYYIKQQK